MTKITAITVGKGLMSDKSGKEGNPAVCHMWFAKRFLRDNFSCITFIRPPLVALAEGARKIEFNDHALLYGIWSKRSEFVG